MKTSTITAMFCLAAAGLNLLAEETVADTSKEPVLPAAEATAETSTLPPIPAAEAVAEISDNPYAAIVSRNAFSLRDKPVETPKPKAEVAPPPEDVDIALTGVAEIKGEAVAFFATPKEDAPGKYQYFSLKDGEKNPHFVLESIDDDKGAVQIRQNGKRMTLNVKDNGITSMRKAPASRSRASSRGRSPRTTSASNRKVAQPVSTPSATAQTGPRIIGRGGNTQNTGGVFRPSAQNVPIQQNALQNGRPTRSTSGRLNSGTARTPRTSGSQRPPAVNRDATEQAVLMEVDAEVKRSQGVRPPPSPWRE
jgi:hypothetical protein